MVGGYHGRRVSLAAAATGITFVNFCRDKQKHVFCRDTNCHDKHIFVAAKRRS